MASVAHPPTVSLVWIFILLGYNPLYGPFLDDLAVDTGSSNTWVGAKAPYVKTNTSVDASESVVSIASTPGSLDQLNPKTYGSGRGIRHRFLQR